MSDEEDEGGGGGGGFRLMFVTLSMILLAFFILLNSMATLDESRTREALGSLLGSFGLLPGAHSVEQENEVLQREKNLVESTEAFRMFEKVQRHIEELMAGNTNVAHHISVTFDKQTGEMKVIISDEFLFAPGTAVISPRLFQLLGDVGRMAMETNGNVKVIGHTDPRGKAIDNWRLSLERGVVVARHIESAADIPTGRICAVGASYFQPKQDNKNIANRASNRRVEILVSTGKGTM